MTLDEPGLSALLEQIPVDVDPALLSRVRSGGRRRLVRRRATAATAGALVVAVAVTVPVALAGQGGSPNPGPITRKPTPTPSPSPTSTSFYPPTDAAAPPVGSRSGSAVELAVTAQLGRELTDAKARAENIPANEYAGVDQDTPLHYARDEATGIEWAAARIDGKPRSLRAEVSTQDAGSYVLFRRTPQGVWVADDIGANGEPAGYYCSTGLPTDVTVLWNWPRC